VDPQSLGTAISVDPELELLIEVEILPEIVGAQCLSQTIGRPAKLVQTKPVDTMAGLERGVPFQ
jgi:hypothetical protein